MKLGEKLKQARLEAGLSQRQLCGDVITRNMLSQIEHGTALPSMSTMNFLAKQLGRPVSYFLEEEAAVSANTACIAAAWDAFEKGQYSACADTLKAYRSPDPVLDRERNLLMCMNALCLAEAAAEQGKAVYARQLLITAENLEGELFWLPELRIRRLRLQAELSDGDMEEALPNPDPDLMLRARAAMSKGNYADCARYLDAMDSRDSARWRFLRGKAAAGAKQYASAAEYLQAAEGEFPQEAAALLEECFRELGDYKQAYYYACRRR